jgi:hypothetical protein
MGLRSHDNRLDMAATQVSHALLQYVDDELLRAPLLFDQLVEGTVDHARKGLAEMTPLQRSAVADLMQALQTHKLRLADYFMESLREQVSADVARHAPRSLAKASKPQSLALVDEEEVAMDVQLSHAIEAIKSVAEYELRELQTYTSALVGDMDVTQDHNPFRAETWARALWAASQALPLSRGHQVNFMRHASTPLAQLLRRSYAASTSRLESMGVEPAAYRTLILPAGSRRGRPGDVTYSPDLQTMRETMPAPLDEAGELTFHGQVTSARPAPVPASARAPLPASPGYTPPRTSAPPLQVAMPSMATVLPPRAVAPSSTGVPNTPPRREQWREVARHAAHRSDRQAIELVSRLFDAMLGDNRVPQDVNMLISRLHGPAMRLALRDTSLLDKGEHPLWHFINRLAFAAEMSPDPGDPERLQLLKLAQGTIDQLASESEQNTGLYRWALERLDVYLNKRLTRRVAALASQVGALQKLEDKLVVTHAIPSTMHGTLDVQQLDTVPADLLEGEPPPSHSPNQAKDWLSKLTTGSWVRMFLQGRWVQVQLLWPGEHNEIWLFGDGASDATWAVRRRALLTMHGKGLAKSLKQRSVVGAAALKVQEQVAAETA